ncbi:Protopine 6-monooxygenase [Vitis vinifera]|uniref:Protopine 6-monooxygenase n=1 Tax=Vitis vinifera TaxID=29760 RepID=A0A438FQC1_VITVI|nr:Protopine 6-monooxygenase [Vitis vinifera]
MDLPSHFLAIAGLILGLVLWYNHWRGKTLTHKSKGMSPPEPSGAWPFVGHLHLLHGKVPVFRTLGAMADKVGPVFVIRLGMYRTLVVSNREAAKECFTTNDKIFASRPNSSAAKILGYNYAAFAFAPHGPYWREMRKLSMLEILSTRRLGDLMHVQVSELHAGIKDLYILGKDNNWVNPKKVVISEWFEHLTFNVVLRMVAGKRYFNNVVHGGEEARSAIAAIKKVLLLVGASVASDVIPFLEWVDLQGHLSSMKLVAKEMDSLIESWVKEHTGRLNSEASSSLDFIDIMLTKLKDASLFGYSRETIIKATVLTMIVAGSDTTSLTSTWLLSALLNNKHVMKHAQEELDLKVVPHEAMEDCHVGGYHISKGTRLLVNAWKLHRDPAVWSNPEEFQPERFLTSHANVDVFGQHFELIPFGSGRRSCPGLNMGLQMLHLTIARLLQGFDMTKPSILRWT